MIILYFLHLLRRKKPTRGRTLSLCTLIFQSTFFCRYDLTHKITLHTTFFSNLTSNFTTNYSLLGDAKRLWTARHSIHHGCTFISITSHTALFTSLTFNTPTRDTDSKNSIKLKSLCLCYEAYRKTCYLRVCSF